MQQANEDGNFALFHPGKQVLKVIIYFKWIIKQLMDPTFVQVWTEQLCRSWRVLSTMAYHAQPHLLILGTKYFNINSL